MPALGGKTVVLGVTGGISAYKAAETCRLLRKAGADVRVVMTRAATKFITPLTLQTLSGHPVARNLFDPAEEAQIGHIQLADQADLVLVAPATADVIARLAAGMADDLLAAVVLATRAPVLLAPAMNVNMWDNRLTQDNLRRLLADGRITTVGPDRGELACGWIGAGRLVDPAEIVQAAEQILSRSQPGGALAGRRVVVTAGPTHEAVDDVRYLGNRSSGKMGFALAAAAARLGAEVTLIAGPVKLATPDDVARRIDVESALDMQAALAEATGEGTDVVVMAAAVADFRPAERVAGKLDRRPAEGPSLGLVANPDLLAELGRKRAAEQQAAPLLVGFAAEVVGAGTRTDGLEARARAKMKEKGCDVVIANDVGAAGLGFDSDRNAVTLVFAGGPALSLGPADKAVLAEQIWTALLPLVPEVSEEAPTAVRTLRLARRQQPPNDGPTGGPT
jgi:phosphopantothenoylcysteine decarboxylase/phosphopantothenate--cysteine ligase